MYTQTMSDDPPRLPVIQSDGDADSGCSPKVYVSNEEAVVLAAMRTLRDRSLELRRELESAEDPERKRLEDELDRLREEWHALSGRREKAFRRKMIMLGHLPPDEDVALF